MQEVNICVEWLGKGFLMIDYNGKRYTFDNTPKKETIPYAVFKEIILSKSVYVDQMIPASQDNKALQDEVIKLKSQIKELQSTIKEGVQNGRKTAAK